MNLQILGHSTLAMTQRDTHVLGPMLTDAAERLDALRTRTAGGRSSRGAFPK